MKAIVLTESGNIENLKYLELPKPSIKEDEVLVKVNSLSVNPVDFKARQNEKTLTWFYGTSKSVVLGWDLSGVVTEIGSKVTDFNINDEVFGMVNFPGNGSTYAEYVAVPSAHLSVKPASVSHQEAAAATLAALTAWQALVINGDIKKGDKVLVHGASGGVGHYAVQIAKHLGAYVIGTSSAKNRDFLLQLGVDQHIDYKTENFDDILSDIDFVLNTVSADIVDRSIRVMKDGGTIISVAGSGSEKSIEKAKEKKVDVKSILVESSGEQMQKIADLMEQGVIKSHVSKEFSFEEMAEAHLQLETGRTVGKLVVTLHY